MWFYAKYKSWYVCLMVTRWESTQTHRNIMKTKQNKKKVAEIKYKKTKKKIVKRMDHI